MKKSFLLFTIIALLAIGCAREEKKEEKAEATPQEAAEKTRTLVAVVGDKKLYKEDLGDMEVEDAVEQELLYQIAVERGIDKRMEPRVDSYSRSLILDSVRTELLSEIHPEITEEDVENYYREHHREYTALEIVEVAFPSKEAAKDFTGAAEETDDVKQAIEEFSERIPEISTEQYTMVVPIFTSALEVGSLSPISRVEGVYTVQAILNKRPATLSEAYEMIFENVHMIKTEQAYDQLIEKLKKERNVVVHKPGESLKPPAKEESEPTEAPDPQSM